MSRRSRQKRRTLGYVVKRGKSPLEDNSLTDSQCGGDKGKFSATRPNRTIKGTGQWLGANSGIGAVGTRPEGQRGPSLKSARAQ